MITSYKHPESEVILHKVGGSREDIYEPHWYVHNSEDDDWSQKYTEREARLIAYWAMQVEITVLQNKIDSLTEWADQVKHHDFEEYFKEYVQCSENQDRLP